MKRRPCKRLALPEAQRIGYVAAQLMEDYI